MRTVIFYFLLCLPAVAANGQPLTEKKVLAVEGFAEQTVRADEIYYSITSLAETHRLLESLDTYWQTDSFGFLPVSRYSRKAAPGFPDGGCAQADSMLHSWLSFYGSDIELMEQELYDEIGVAAASDRFLLKIKSLETFKSLLARLETCSCFIGELVQVAYSRPEALRHELTLHALRNAKENAEEMLSLLGTRIKSVYNIAPAKVTWVDALMAPGDDWSPFDPKLNRTLELKCRVQVSVQFLFK